MALAVLHSTSRVGITESQQLEVLIHACKCLEDATWALTVFISLIAYVYDNPKGNLSCSVLKAQVTKPPSEY